MDPCKPKQPHVIDNALIQQCIKDQRPKGEAGRLLLLEGVPLDEVQVIRFEYMNILKIDHLWVLPSLTKLSLTNNLIEKIENLDSLINLKELDLSFNKITKIENLNALINLERLNLLENKITKLENMDELNNLTIFSIGRNLLENVDNLCYLRRFDNLKSLNLKGNPVAEMNDFRIFVAAFFPQLVYYEYKIIHQHERDSGTEQFKKKLSVLETEDGKERAVRELAAQLKRDIQLYSISFVESLNSRQLFDFLFEEDFDGLKLLELNDEIKEYYVEFEEQFIDACKNIFEIGQKQHVIRQEEISQFTKCVKEAKEQNQKESIEHMEKFLKEKDEIFSRVKTYQNELLEDIITEENFVNMCEPETVAFNEAAHKAWKVLMKLEMELYEQMDEVNSNFRLVLTELLNQFIEASQALFSQIRSLEVTYAENVGESAGRFMTNLNLDETIVVPEPLKEIMYNRDTLQNALGGSHDMHMQLIDVREDTLVNRAKNWLDNFLDTLIKDEIKRNRAKVLEICHFLDIQREEFDELKDIGIGIDPDVTAALAD